MDKLVTLQDLFIEQLREMYNAERHELDFLDSTTAKTSSSDLRHLIERHQRETEEHINRLERSFDLLHLDPVGEVSKPMLGIIDDGNDIIDRCADAEVLDAAVIAINQYINHYQIAGYGTARSYANILGHTEIEDLLRKSLETEREIDRELTKLAEENINLKAKEAMERA